VRAALRLGAFQLVFLDGVPRYAAVNESVELVRRSRLERAVPFANAVLRRLADEGRAHVEALPDATWQEAALAHSYPDWIAETWWRDLGPEGARALMRAQNEAPPTVVRLVRGEVEGEPDPGVPGAWHVGHVDAAAVAEGRIWPQSAGSQLAGLAVASADGERVLDLCAAPGGKTTMLAGEVVAVELNEARARELEENVRRLGAANVQVVCADGRDLPAELTGFDRALVDAPCSGLGVLASRPDLRWRSQPLPELQLELLLAAAARVRPGGSVTYSVCTVNRDEAENVVDAALAASGLEVDTGLGETWPRFRHPQRPEFLQTYPHVHGTSGFFVARLHVA
jgi:16S rRNA (cytosine967-C5)-methyltransferase